MFENLVKQKKISPTATSLRLLDVGVEQAYWHQVGKVSKKVLKNKLLTLGSLPRFSDMHTIACDAKELCFNDHEFDIAFSNSVIEHVNDRKRVAYEIRKVEKKYWVQTSYYLLFSY